MQNKFKIKDSSGDKKYFTMIPNYIVNHSTPYEQAIYLYMKRVAGETGSCWTSAKTMATQLGCSRNTIAKYRDALVERGWIRVIGKAGKTKPTNEYEIVDLWDLNMSHYSKKDSSRGELSKKGRKESSRGDKKVHEVNLDSSRGGHKEEPTKNNQEEKHNSTANGALINTIIPLFKIINPSWKRLFKIKPQRAAIERLLEDHGEEKLRAMIAFLPTSNGQTYAPTITTPVELEHKLGKLIAWGQKEKSKSKSKGKKILV